MAEVEYRPVPAWPNHRVGSDRSVWVRESRRGVDFAPPVIAGGTARSHGRVKLTADSVTELRRLWAEGSTYESLCERYGVSHRTIWDVVTGRTWADVPWPDVADVPRWRRLEVFTKRGGAPSVRLYDAGRVHVRVVELLYSAAFEPSSVHPAWLARLGPRSPRPAAVLVPRSARPAVPPPPERPLEPAIAAAEVPDLLEQIELDQADAENRPAGPPIIILDDDEGQARGESHGRHRLSDRKVTEARLLHSAGWTDRVLAKRYGVGRVTMHYALVGKTWSHLPMPPARRSLAPGRKSSSQRARDLAAGGLSVAEIAADLGIGQSTVRRYLD